MFKFINLKKITDFYGVKEHLNAKQLGRHPLFYVGLAVRFILIFSITPYIHKIWFLPFINGSMDQISFDPWTDFIENGGDKLAFPYGFVMFFAYKCITSFGFYLDLLFKGDLFFKVTFGLKLYFYYIGALQLLFI